MAVKKRSTQVVELVRQIDRIVHGDTGESAKPLVRRLLKDYRDQKIATVLDIDPDHRQVVFTSLPVERQIVVLDLVNAHTLRSIISNLSHHDVVHLVERAPSMISQKITGVVERSRLDQLIPMITSDAKRHNLITFVNYPHRSVGRIMQPEVLTVPANIAVSAAVREVSGFNIANGPIYQVYVLGDDDTFMGTVPISELVRAGSNIKIGDLYLKKPPVISPTTSQSRAAQLFSEYDLIEAPVIANGKVVGRILVDDILDVIRQEFSEDAQKFAGITAEETLETPARVSSRRRLPWMVANIFLDLLAVSIILPFEETIGAVTALAVLMPVISDMGGNVGIQSLTVSIRALADNKPQWRLVVKELSKEVRVGLLNGVVLGVIVGVVAFIGWQNPFLGFVVMTALLLNTILASVVGGVLPIILRKLKKDPAMMSGAILTTITDFFGFLIFLGLARLFLDYLV